ncbi:glycosyltransferase family 2 protein [Ursidibacter sp. B-7004-1]
MDKKPIISIIVAAYNVVEYLSDAIDSVISQWDDDWELIVVNDGAIDGAYSLLEEYKLKINSDRFVVIHKNNEGLVAARNSGVELARGEYLVFLDGDDFFVPKRLNLIKFCLKEHSPDCLIIDFNYWDDGEFYANSTHKSLEPRKLLLVSDNTVAAVYENAQVYLWKHIFKKSIFEKHPAPEGKHYEDISTIPSLVSECQTIFYLPAKVVYYRQREGSIMKVKNQKNILDLSSALNIVTDNLKKSNPNMSKELALQHSIFALKIFTWACGDTLSNKLLSPRDLYPVFVNNFDYTNLVNLKDLKYGMKDDVKTWRKFYMFYNYPKSFYLAFYLRHNFNRTYKLLNKLRNFIYKT